MASRKFGLERRRRGALARRRADAEHWDKSIRQLKKSVGQLKKLKSKNADAVRFKAATETADCHRRRELANAEVNTLKRVLGIVSIWLLLIGTAFGQINVSERYDVYDPIVLTCESQGPEGAIKHVIWGVEGTGRVSTREFADGSVAVWAAPGKYSVEATVLLTLRRDIGGESVEVLVPGGFRRHRSTFTVGTGPQPDPDSPTPRPDNDCDGLSSATAKAVCGLVETEVAEASRSKRSALSAMYATAADRLENAEFINPSQAAEFLRSERSRILTGADRDAWESFGVKVSGLFDGIDPGRAALIQFYRDMAEGLKG